MFLPGKDLRKQMMFPLGRNDLGGKGLRKNLSSQFVCKPNQPHTVCKQHCSFQVDMCLKGTELEQSGQRKGSNCQRGTDNTVKQRSACILLCTFQSGSHSRTRSQFQVDSRNQEGRDSRQNSKFPKGRSSLQDTVRNLRDWWPEGHCCTCQQGRE